MVCRGYKRYVSIAERENFARILMNMSMHWRDLLYFLIDILSLLNIMMIHKIIKNQKKMMIKEKMARKMESGMNGKGIASNPFCLEDAAKLAKSVSRQNIILCYMRPISGLCIQRPFQREALTVCSFQRWRLIEDSDPPLSIGEVVDFGPLKVLYQGVCDRYFLDPEFFDLYQQSPGCLEGALVPIFGLQKAMEWYWDSKNKEKEDRLLYYFIV
jgi:hypothetical protein